MENKLESFAKLFQQPRPQQEVPAPDKGAPAPEAALSEKRGETPLVRDPRPPAPPVRREKPAVVAKPAAETASTAMNAVASKASAPIAVQEKVSPVAIKGAAKTASVGKESTAPRVPAPPIVPEKARSVAGTPTAKATPAIDESAPPKAPVSPAVQPDAQPVIVTPPAKATPVIEESPASKAPLPVAAEQNAPPVAAKPAAKGKVAIKGPSPPNASASPALQEKAPPVGARPAPRGLAATQEPAPTIVSAKPVLQGELLPGVVTPPVIATPLSNEAPASQAPAILVAEEKAPVVAPPPPKTASAAKAPPPAKLSFFAEPPNLSEPLDFAEPPNSPPAAMEALDERDAPSMAAALAPDPDEEHAVPVVARRIRLRRRRALRSPPPPLETGPVMDRTPPRPSGPRVVALVAVLILAIGGVAAIWIARMQALTVAEETHETLLITDIPASPRRESTGIRTAHENDAAKTQPINSAAPAPTPQVRSSPPATERTVISATPPSPAASPPTSNSPPSMTSKAAPPPAAQVSPAAQMPPVAQVPAVAQMPAVVPAPTPPPARLDANAVPSHPVEKPNPESSATARSPAIPAAGPDLQSGGASEAQWLKYALPMPPPSDRPWIAVVIDDVGLDKKRTERAISLRGPIAMSFLAYASDLPRETAEARRNGHELIVHVPVEPTGQIQDLAQAGSGAGAGRAELLRRLRWDLSRFDGYVGIDNHMGNRLTGDPEGTSAVIEELRTRGLLFLDDRAVGGGTSFAIARRLGVPTAESDVFLDDEINATAIDARLADVEAVAHRNGTAVAIAHPHDQTLDALTVWLAELPQRGFQLVPLTAIVRQRNLHVVGLNESAK